MSDHHSITDTDQIGSHKKTNRTKPVAFLPGQRQEPKLNTFQKHELIQKVVEYILKGEKRSVIIDMIEQNAPVKLSKTGMQNVYEDAQRWLEENVQLEAAQIVAIHKIWYEQMYRYFDEIGHAEGKNECMKGIERLMGLHKEKTVAKINKKTVINLAPVQYDTSQLNTEEKNRLEELLKKAS